MQSHKGNSVNLCKGHVNDGICYTRHKAWMFSGWYVRELRLAISSIISS